VLPFSINAELSKPGFVILGTGLQECLLAAHYSKLCDKTGLIIDIDRTYGGSLKTVTIKELVALNRKKTMASLYQFLEMPEFDEQNNKYYSNLLATKSYKGFSIDLEPNFFFGSSVCCEMLK
jgi:RAB protein geranylgeranyltransferase component A